MVIALLGLKMSPGRVNIESGVTDPPARYTQSGKSSTRTTTANNTAKIQDKQGQQAVNTS